MDIESLTHLERLRDLRQIKVALLCLCAKAPAREVRFERSARNTLYWEPVDALAAQVVAAQAASDRCTPVTLYGQPCRLVCAALAAVPDSPYAIAVVSAEGEELETVVAHLRNVTRDYWYGSSFFK
jgi:hypothetical protein